MSKPVWIRKLSEVKLNLPLDDALFMKAAAGKAVDKHER
jgi:hypothetical protein